LWVSRHSSAVLRDGADMESLIDVNRTIMAGLGGDPAAAPPGAADARAAAPAGFASAQAATAPQAGAPAPQAAAPPPAFGASPGLATAPALAVNARPGGAYGRA
jgi:hypothetical protein